MKYQIIFAITMPKTFWQLNIDKQYTYMHVGMHEKYYFIGGLNIGNFVYLPKFTCQYTVYIYIMYAWYLKLISPLCQLSVLAC